MADEHQFSTSVGPGREKNVWLVMTAPLSPKHPDSLLTPDRTITLA